MCKFADGCGVRHSDAKTWSAETCTPEQAHNTAYGFDIDGEYAKLSADAVFQHYNQAISVLNPLLGAQSLTQPYQSPRTASIQTPSTAQIPSERITPNTKIVTDNESGVEDDILIVRKLRWAGTKDTFDAKSDVALSWYHQQQNNFRVPSACSPEAGFRASCAGKLNALSLYADHHFTKRVDFFAGVTSRT